MMLRPVLVCVVIIPFVAGFLDAQESATSTGRTLDFGHEIVPILRSACVECHSGTKAMGGLSMNSRRMFLEAGYVDLDSPERSYLLELVTSKDPEQQMPPKDRPRLSAAQVSTLRQWIAAGLPWEAGFTFGETAYEPPLQPRQVELPPTTGGRSHPIDRILGAYFQEHQVTWPSPISDGAFLRRASLDLIGLLPEPSCLHQFVEDNSPNKRPQLIRSLLAQRTAYAEHWLSFYNDLLRNDYSGTGFITGGRSQISSWLYSALLNNKPFDRFAYELLAPSSPESRGFIEGIRWRGDVSAGQTVEIQFAQSVAQAFLGINLKCASCHDSFIDRWTLEQAYQLAAVYADHPLELHRCDLPTGKQAVAGWLFPELGNISPDASREERLEQMASLMTHPDNGRFTRTIVNRLWHRLMGYGIVHPLDAMQTEPWSEDLLDYLAVHLAEHDYDLKQVLELIATSEIYQAKSSVLASPSEADFVFQGPRARRMTAEQLVDCIWQVTDAAPATIDAPVVRAWAGKDILQDFQEPANAHSAAELLAGWIWKGESPVAAAEQVVFKKDFNLTTLPVFAGAILACDDEFELFVNGRLFAVGTDWSSLNVLALRSQLKQGDNTLLIVARNSGRQPNPAGLLLQLELRWDDGKKQVVASDDSWQVSSERPITREGRLSRPPKSWSLAKVVKTQPEWKASIEPHAKQALIAFEKQSLFMVRASLLKNNALLRSLGRPTRDQIVSTRPTELTTLEAIDLANEPVFAETLRVGADSLLSGIWDSPQELVGYLFEFALSRRPLPDEEQAMLSMLSNPPRPSEVEDSLWALFMLPEFLIVR